MNPDVPSLEVSRRLAEVWRNPAEFTRHLSWVKYPDDWRLDEGRDVVNASAWGNEVVPARTIGEMLALIQERHWYVQLATTAGYGEYEASMWYWKRLSDAYHNFRHERNIVGHAVSGFPAEALGLALAEALEQEKEKP